MRPTLRIYRSLLSRPSQRWRWSLIANNGRKLANGGEGYTDADECERQAWKVVSGCYGDAAVLRG